MNKARNYLAGLTISCLAFGAHAEDFASPDHDVKISVKCDRDGANCVTSYKTNLKSGKLEGLADNVSVQWFGNTAGVTSSCGSYCSATFLVDRTGLIGTYSDVLAYDEQQRCVAFLKEPDVIRFTGSNKRHFDVKVTRFKPAPMKTTSFASVAQDMKFENGDFKLSYMDEAEKDHKVLLKKPCAGL